MKSNVLVLTKKEFNEFVSSSMTQLDYEIVRQQDGNDEIIVKFNQDDEFDFVVDFFKRLAVDNRAKELDKEIKKITDKLNLRVQRLNDLEEEITNLRIQLKRATAEKEHITGNTGNKDKRVDHKYEDSENEVEIEIKEVNINDLFDSLFNSTVVHLPEDEGDEHNCEECPSKHMCSNRK